MGKDEAKQQAIILAKEKFRRMAAICLIDNEWVPAAHHEDRYYTSYKPFDVAEKMWVCDTDKQPHVWVSRPTGLGAGLRDILEALG